MRQHYTDQENNSMLSFVAKKSKTAEKPFVMRNLFAEYAKKYKSTRSANHLVDHFRNLARKLHDSPKFDEETKIRMLFATKSPGNWEFLNLVKKKVEILIFDHRGVVEKYQNKGVMLSKATVSSSARHRKVSDQKPKKEEEIEDSEKKVKKCESDDEVEIIGELVRRDPSLPKIEPIILKKEPDALQDEPIFYYPPPVEGIRSLRTVLSSLQNFVVFLDAPQLAEMQMKIEAAIFYVQQNYFDDMENDAEKVVLGFKTLLLAVNPPTFDGAHGAHDFLSCKFVLKLLKGLVLNLRAPELQNVLASIEAALQQIGDGDDNVPINNIRVAIDTAFNLVY